MRHLRNQRERNWPVLHNFDGLHRLNPYDTALPKALQQAKDILFDFRSARFRILCQQVANDVSRALLTIDTRQNIAGRASKLQCAFGNKQHRFRGMQSAANSKSRNGSEIHSQHCGTKHPGGTFPGVT